MSINQIDSQQNALPPIENQESEKKISPELNEANMTLLLNLSEVEILKNIEDLAAQEGYEKKDEFHVTGIGYPNGKKIRSILAGQEKMAEIKALINSMNWQDFKLRDEFFRIAKSYANGNNYEVRESIIQMVDMPALKEFYEKLNGLLGTTFSLPPAHVTLFTKGTDPKTSKVGVGLYSESDFERYNQGKIEK